MILSLEITIALCIVLEAIALHKLAKSIILSSLNVAACSENAN